VSKQRVREITARRRGRSLSQVIENPNVAKAGGVQSQGVKGEVVAVYHDLLTTQDLKSSGFPDVLGRS
jgi:hypothetical protein